MAETKIHETVDPKLVFYYIEKANPEITNSALARAIGVNDKRIYEAKKQQTMGLYTADKFLSAFDLGYLLSTGDIPITATEIKIQETKSPLSKTAIEKRNKELRKEVKYLREQLLKTQRSRDKWKEKALAAQA